VVMATVRWVPTGNGVESFVFLSGLVAAAALAARHPGAVAISATSGTGIPEVLRAVADRLHVADHVVELVVPWSRGDVLAAVHREGEIVREDAAGDATRVHVVLDEVGRARFREFVAS